MMILIVLVISVVSAIVAFITGAFVAMTLALLAWTLKRSWSPMLRWGIGALVAAPVGAALIMSLHDSGEYSDWFLWLGGISVVTSVLGLLMVGAMATGARSVWLWGRRLASTADGSSAEGQRRIGNSP